MKYRFVDVLLPLPLPQLLTYSIPEGLDQLQVGSRVLVPFRKSKIITGLVVNEHQVQPAFEAKELIQMVDGSAIVVEAQFKLWQWIASYYACSLGEVMAAALPAGFRLESETKVILNPDYDSNLDSLSDAAFLIVEALQIRESLTIKEVEKIVNLKNAWGLVNRLVDSNVLLLEESLNERYKQKKELYVSFPESFTEESISQLVQTLEKRSPKQVDVLVALYDYLIKHKTSSIRKSLLLAHQGISASAVQTLIKNNVLLMEERSVDRVVYNGAPAMPLPALQQFQQEALIEIGSAFAQQKTVLLHGVTGSGKTEVYQHLIDKALEKGEQVLMLIPEIALTTQLIQRMQRYFANKVLVYHSKYSSAERVEVYNKILNHNHNSGGQIIIGARSAVMLPFTKIGLIIVDEEHDQSYKQAEPAPRYHARDTAAKLAQLHQAHLLLGSATPSLESYYRSKLGEIVTIKMLTRFNNVPLPQIKIVDIKDLEKRKLMKSWFSPMLLDAVEYELQHQRQIMLFQNRRGYAPYLTCNLCAWVPQCKKCAVSLTYHKNKSLLLCHYCGYTEQLPEACKACANPGMVLKGLGTEKLEEEIKIFFPDAIVARLDFDSSRSKHHYKTIIQDFEDRKIKILVGTQMITKGLDFDNVGLSCVLNADMLLRYPDFRATEKAFQLMLQLAGRAGRKKLQGTVVVQTGIPSHPIFLFLTNADYYGFAEAELLERERYAYPPYTRMCIIEVKHKNRMLLSDAANYLTKILKKDLAHRIIGPVEPTINRINNYYINEIVMKVERTASSNKAKEMVLHHIRVLMNIEKFAGLKINLDVDPA
jgi:primosomal protein N' (replication factor Y) (superfamily II helicase)